MAKVNIALYEKRDGKTISQDFMCDEGMQLGKKLRRLMKVPEGQLFSTDTHGHVQEKQGPVGDNDIIYIRAGREFMRIPKEAK